jgi:hypothetical protein
MASTQGMSQVHVQAGHCLGVRRSIAAEETEMVRMERVKMRRKCIVR